MFVIPLNKHFFMKLILQGSRRISYKDLIKGCLSIICEMSHLHAEHSDDMTLPKSSSAELFKSLHTAGAISFPEVRKCSFRALQKFLLMVRVINRSCSKVPRVCSFEH